jgi:hypothetical protein
MNRAERRDYRASVLRRIAFCGWTPGTSREVRRVVWPVLREEGFDSFTGRTAWRYVGTGVDVVNFSRSARALQMLSAARRSPFGQPRRLVARGR